MDNLVLFTLFVYIGVQHMLCFCFIFLHLVCPMLPVFSGLSIFDCPFDILLRLFKLCPLILTFSLYIGLGPCLYSILPSLNTHCLYSILPSLNTNCLYSILPSLNTNCLYSILPSLNTNWSQRVHDSPACVSWPWPHFHGLLRLSLLNLCHTFMKDPCLCFCLF